MVNGVKNYHQAITWQLMSIYEPLFKDSSYGYCLNRVQKCNIADEIFRKLFCRHIKKVNGGSIAYNCYLKVE